MFGPGVEVKKVSGPWGRDVRGLGLEFGVEVLGFRVEGLGGVRLRV